MTASNVLIHSRPNPQAKQFTQQLQAYGINNFHLPLFELQCCANAVQNIVSGFHIFVSAKAAECASHAVLDWYQKQTQLSISSSQIVFFSIGPATTQSLIKQGLNGLARIIEIAPPHTSETLLNHPLLKTKLETQAINIWCAKNGRRLIQKTLTERNALIQEHLIYTKSILSISSQKRQQLANFMHHSMANDSTIFVLATSQLIMQKQTQLLARWRKQLHLLTISDRLLQQAKQQGWYNIELLQDWSNEQIIERIV